MPPGGLDSSQLPSAKAARISFCIFRVALYKRSPIWAPTSNIGFFFCPRRGRASAAFVAGRKIYRVRATVRSRRLHGIALIVIIIIIIINIIIIPPKKNAASDVSAPARSTREVFSAEDPTTCHSHGSRAHKLGTASTLPFCLLSQMPRFLRRGIGDSFLYLLRLHLPFSPRSYPLGSTSALSAPPLPPPGSISRLNPSIADGIWMHLKAPDRFVVLRSSSGWVLGKIRTF